MSFYFIASSKSPSKKSGSGSGDMFFHSESVGLKVEPKTVLIISLVYMGIVVLLHIFGKIRGGQA